MSREEEKRRIAIADYAAIGATLVAFGTLALQAYTLHLQDVRQQLRDKEARDAQIAADVKKPLTDISGLLASYGAEREVLQKQVVNLAAHPSLSADQAKNDLRRLHNDLANMTAWQESQGVLLPSTAMDHALESLLNQESGFVSGLESTIEQSPGSGQFTPARVSATDGQYQAGKQSYSSFREMVRAYLHKSDGG